MSRVRHPVFAYIVTDGFQRIVPARLHGGHIDHRARHVVHGDIEFDLEQGFVDAVDLQGGCVTVGVEGEALMDRQHDREDGEEDGDEAARAWWGEGGG